jgi:hypothetical protein
MYAYLIQHIFHGVSIGMLYLTEGKEVLLGRKKMERGGLLKKVAQH